MNADVGSTAAPIQSSAAARVVAHVRIRVAVVAFLILSGCATGSFEKPADFDPRPLRERAETALNDDIRISTAVPSRDESLAIFGVDLSSKGIQPVWLEIENMTDERMHFMRTGLDPEYFAPREVAFTFRDDLSEESGMRLDQHLEQLSIGNLIRPDATESGFVYTYTDFGSKFVTVDLVGDGWSGHFSLTPEVPGHSARDEQLKKIDRAADAMTPRNVSSESQLRQVLEQMPCCASDENGVHAGPLNIVVVGDPSATGPALLRRHFRVTRASPFYAFGRQQDLSLKKSSGWVAAQPHVLRAWLTDVRFNGKVVWIAHISMPLGGRFADEDETRIDPNVDDARLDLVQDAMYSQFLSKMGFVKGVGAASIKSPQATANGSEYYTDGLRAVLEFQESPLSLDEIGFFDWERLIDHYGDTPTGERSASFR